MGKHNPRTRTRPTTVPRPSPGQMANTAATIPGPRAPRRRLEGLSQPTTSLGRVARLDAPHPLRREAHGLPRRNDTRLTVHGTAL